MDLDQKSLVTRIENVSLSSVVRQDHVIARTRLTLLFLLFRLMRFTSDTMCVNRACNKEQQQSEWNKISVMIVTTDIEISRYSDIPILWTNIYRYPGCLATKICRRGKKKNNKKKGYGSSKQHRTQFYNSARGFIHRRGFVPGVCS